MYLALAFPIAKGTRKDTNFPSQKCTYDVPYPPITDYVTGKKTRREFLQRQHNAAHIDLADWILKYLETDNNYLRFSIGKRHQYIIFVNVNYKD